MPSKIDPTAGIEDCVSSLKLDISPPLSGSHNTQIPSNGQPSVVPLKSSFSQKCENRSDEVFMPPNHTIAAQCSSSSNYAYTNDARESGNSKDKAEVGGANGQNTKEVEVAAEREQDTKVPCTHSLPVQLTATHREHVARLAKTSPPFTASQPMSMTQEPARTLDLPSALRPKSTTQVPVKTMSLSTVSRPTSITQVPARASSPLTASRFSSTALQHSSMASRLLPTTPSTCSFGRVTPQASTSSSSSTVPYTCNSSPTFHRWSPMPSPHSFTNAISQLSTLFSSKGRRTRHSVASVPLSSPSSAQKRPSKAQT